MFGRQEISPITTGEDQRKSRNKNQGPDDATRQEDRLSRRSFLNGVAKVAVVCGGSMLIPGDRHTGFLKDDDRRINRELLPLPDFEGPPSSPRMLFVPLLGKGETVPYSITDLDQSITAVMGNIYDESYGKMRVRVEVPDDWQGTDLPDDRDQENVIDIIGSSIATNLGYRLDKFDAVMYILPPDRSPMYSGLAFSSNGRGGWRRGVTYTSDNPLYFQHVMMHEIGHIFGMTHSDSRDQSGVETEYGAQFDAMNADSTVNVYDAPHRVLMGWIGKDQVTSVTHEGIYSLGLIDQKNFGVLEISGTRVLRLKKPDTNEYYYISMEGGGMVSPSFRVYAWNEKPATPPDEIKPNSSIPSLSWEPTHEFFDEKNGIRINLVPNENFPRIELGQGEQFLVRVSFDK